MADAVVYCRVSTRHQAEEGSSLDSQRDACLRLAQERGLTVSEVLLEDASGVDLDRPLLTRARELVKSSQTKALICYSTDRLARNPIHIAIIGEECQKAGTELLFVTEPLDTSPEGQLVAYVKGYAAQLEREKIKDRTVRGKRARAASGKLPHGDGGLGVYGYRYNPSTGHRDIYEPEAQVVRDIYRWLVEEGLTLRSIVRRLHSLGIPTRHNSPRWQDSTVSRVIHSPLYKGVTYRFNGTVVIPNATPRIVSDELWEAAQQRLLRNAALSRRNTRHDYLLSGYIWCSECGRRLRAHFHSGRDVRYYECSGKDYRRHYPGKPCPLGIIRADPAEEAVWERVAEVLRHPELVLAELERLTKEGAYPALEERLAENQARMKSLLQRERRLYVQFEFGEVDEAYIRERLGAIKAQQHELEAERAHLLKQQDEVPSLEKAREALRELVERIGVNLQTFAYEDKRLALEALEARVVVSPDGQLSLRLAVPIELQTSRSTWPARSPNRASIICATATAGSTPSRPPAGPPPTPTWNR